MRSRPSVPFAVATLALLLALAACSGATEPEDEFRTARARWARYGPASYSMTIQIACGCLPEVSAPVVVTVRNGIVTSRRYVHSGADVDPRLAEVFPSVEGLFAMIEAALRAGGRPHEVRYHPVLGYPTRLALGDPAVDDPRWTVSDFRAE